MTSLTFVAESNKNRFVKFCVMQKHYSACNISICTMGVFPEEDQSSKRNIP